MVSNVHTVNIYTRRSDIEEHVPAAFETRGEDRRMRRVDAAKIRKKASVPGTAINPYKFLLINPTRKNDRYDTR